MIERLTAQLRRDEGEILHVYPDHLGFWTIGVGRLVDARRGGGITPEESAYLLRNDITRREAELERRIPFWAALNDARKGALLNMAFQLGVDGLLGFQKMLAAMRDEHWADAAYHATQSEWARTQTPKRAARIARQIETGEWQ